MRASSSSGRGGSGQAHPGAPQGPPDPFAAQLRGPRHRTPRCARRGGQAAQRPGHPGRVRSRRRQGQDRRVRRRRGDRRGRRAQGRSGQAGPERGRGRRPGRGGAARPDLFLRPEHEPHDNGHLRPGPGHGHRTGGGGGPGRPHRPGLHPRRGHQHLPRAAPDHGHLPRHPRADGRQVFRGADRQRGTGGALSRDKIRTAENRDVVSMDGRPCSLAWLGAVLGVEEDGPKRSVPTP